MTPQPLPLPSPALLKWELQLHNPVQPVIMAPPPTTMVEVYDRLAAQENLDSARRAEFERRVGIDPNQARLDALATLTAAAGPLTDIHNPQPINGGATAWGGGTVGSTNPTTRTMTLGYHGYPEGKPVGAPGGGGGGLPIGIAIEKLAKAVWSGGKWVYKETSKWLDVAGRVMTAEAIRRWTVDNWPKPEPPPPSVPTFFQLAGNKMLYQHPNQSWLSEPPKGYDYYGKRMY